MARMKVKSLAEIAELAECGKRMSDAVNQVVSDFIPWDIKDCWLAFTLENGTVHSDKKTRQAILYDSLSAAKKHTDEWKYCYMALRCYLGGIGAKDCEIFIDVHRQARAVNMAQTDPDKTLIMPFEAGDVFRSAQRGEL